jgi:hypothetical protein
MLIENFPIQFFNTNQVDILTIFKKIVTSIKLLVRLKRIFSRKSVLSMSIEREPTPTILFRLVLRTERDVRICILLALFLITVSKQLQTILI